MKLKAWLLALLCLLCLPIQAAAAETDPTYDFSLTANGQQTLEVNNGDIITVNLHLRRTDAQESSLIYGMQSELRYDAGMLEVVEGSSMVYANVTTTDIALVSGHREFYMNFLSLSGGTLWEADTLVGSVQFRVIGNTGVTAITNEDFLVSLPDGSGSYPCTANELMLILSTDCTVTFASNGGSEVQPITVIFGEKIPRPQDPVREGYRLQGWYRDIHLTEPWDFETDTVQGNMTLYAKWETAPAEEAPEAPVTIVVWLLLSALLVAAFGWLFWKKRRNAAKQ